MKYISSRSVFLKNHKLKNNKELEINKILEGIGYSYGPENAGPFSNAIPWGDTLLGRLIHNIIRKARVGIGLVGIKRETERLKAEFDRLLDGSVTAAFDEDTKIKYRKIIIFSYLDNIGKAVENEEKLIIIKNLTKDCINRLNYYKDFENKDFLIKSLEDFLKFLENLKEESESTEGGSYSIMVKNLKSLDLIINNYKLIKTKENIENVENISKKRYTTKEGDTINIIAANVGVKADIIRGKNQEVLTKVKNKLNTDRLPENIVLVIESEKFGENSNPNRNEIDPSNIHLIQSFSKIKKDIEELTSSKDGIAIDSDFIKSIISKSLDKNAKNQIKLLYKEIIRYLAGDKKSEIPEKDNLYNENIEIISNDNNRIIIAKKIANFTKRAMQFKKANLYNQLGDLGNPLKTYVETMEELITKKEEDKTDNTTQEIKENSNAIFKYYNFIIEKDNNRVTMYQKIKDYWDRMDKKGYMMSLEEVKALKDSVQKIGKKEMIIIDGIDPIIEIVKCFNRAYKLHTTQVIPTGRGGGQVTNKIFREYTCFGSGTKDSAGRDGGPYRNNAMFDQWENAVLDIQKETKYQKIFRGETILKTTNGTEIKNAGKNLSLFITSLLNGEDLYKTGSGYNGGVTGKQAEFINKYFDCEVPKSAGMSESYDTGKISDSINTKKLKFSKDNFKFNDYKELKNSFFAASIIAKNENNIDEAKQIYFYIQEITNDGFAYIAYCRNMKIFFEYIKQSGIAIENGIGRGDMPAKVDITLAFNFIKATRVKIDKLINKDGGFLINGDREIKYLTKKDNKPYNVSELGDKSDKFNIKSCYTLVAIDEKETKERLIADKIDSIIIGRIGGFPKIIESNNISQCEIK